MMRRFHDGVLIYEPWYSLIVGPIEVLERYLGLPATVTIDDVALSDVLGEVIVQLADKGFEITIPLFSVAWLLTLKAAGKIYRGVREQAKITTETVASGSIEGNASTE